MLSSRVTRSCGRIDDADILIRIVQVSGCDTGGQVREQGLFLRYSMFELFGEDAVVYVLCGGAGARQGHCRPCTLECVNKRVRNARWLSVCNFVWQHPLRG